MRLRLKKLSYFSLQCSLFRACLDFVFFGRLALPSYILTYNVGSSHSYLNFFFFLFPFRLILQSNVAVYQVTVSLSFQFYIDKLCTFSRFLCVHLHTNHPGLVQSLAFPLSGYMSVLPWPQFSRKSSKNKCQVS